MYYSDISAFDRTPIRDFHVETSIPKTTPVEVVENEETGDNTLFWAITLVSAIGIVILILYLDNPAKESKIVDKNPKAMCFRSNND